MAVSFDPQTKRKIIKLIAEKAPLTYGQLFGRKYIPPASRQGEYGSLDLDNWMSFERLYRYANLGWNMQDEVANCALWNMCAHMRFNRPTLFLERELGEALLRTEVLQDLNCEDINWKWPSFRVVLPKQLLSIERAKGSLYLTHFDVCYAEAHKPIRCPAGIAFEVDAFAASQNKRDNYHLLEKAQFMYKPDEHGIGISAALDQPENDAVHQTIYGAAKPWGAIKLAESHGITGDLHSPMDQDDADRKLLNRLEHLIFNVLLYLSMVPEDSEAKVIHRDKVIRKENLRHLQPALLEARFVGQQEFRAPALVPSRTGMNPAGGPMRMVAAHWVCGAWRRVPYGPKHSLRRLTWIRPYATGEFRHAVAS